MNINNKNWNKCAELLNEMAKEAEWDKAKTMPYNEMTDKVTNSVQAVLGRYGFDSEDKIKVFMDFFYTLTNKLYAKLKKYWLNGTLDTRIEGLSDDGFHYFLTDILAHGYDAYCEVMEDWTAAYKYKDYEEGFTYCIFDYSTNKIKL